MWLGSSPLQTKDVTSATHSGQKNRFWCCEGGGIHLFSICQLIPFYVIAISLFSNSCILLPSIRTPWGMNPLLSFERHPELWSFTALLLNNSEMMCKMILLSYPIDLYITSFTLLYICNSYFLHYYTITHLWLGL